MESPSWSLHGHRASISSPQFSAAVDLLRPDSGLVDVSFQGGKIAGSVLGSAPVDHKIGGAEEIADCYARGNDLVVTYAQTDQRPFALQVYWSVGIFAGTSVRIDTVLSLQTCLLESFPAVRVATALPAKACDGLSEGALLRSEGSAWSYAQRVHPEDQGDQQIDASSSERVVLSHRLGGQFLEKGVIRRIRVRGLFLPSERDVELATEHLASLTAEAPPLTV